MANLACRVFVGILAAVLVQVVAVEAMDVVGNKMGWAVPSDGPAVFMSFKPGYYLTFNFGTNSYVHDVQRATEEPSFNVCTFTNPIGDLTLTGPVNFTLNSDGHRFYICTIDCRCIAGQKLSVTVTGGDFGGYSSNPGSGLAELLAAGLIASILAEVPARHTVQVVVGDEMGRAFSRGAAASASAGAAYNAGPPSINFIMGDAMTFDARTNSHAIQRVTKESFDACTSSNPIGDVTLTGPANVTLNTAGDHFDVCSIGCRCLAGQKLSVTIANGGSSQTVSPQPLPPPRAGAPYYI